MRNLDQRTIASSSTSFFFSFFGVGEDRRFSAWKPTPGWLLILTLTGMCAVGEPLRAQGVFPFTGVIPVGAPAQTQTVMVPITVTGPVTVATVRVLTQGSAGLDYQPGTGDLCTGNTFHKNDSCSFGVSFSAKYPGLRGGAIVLTDSSGAVVGTSFLEANASGSVSVLVPGVINTVAGDVNWTYGGDNGPATASSIFLPMGEVTDAAGNLYIADTNNNRIRRVDAKTGTMTTVAGGPLQGYSGDTGPGVAAALSSPTALAIDGAGNLYIADCGNLVVRMLSTVSGIITTIAGVGGPAGPAGDGGLATAAHLTAVGGLALDAQHALYLADTGNNVIRRLDLGTGIITRFAGTGTVGSANGIAASASFNTPEGINFGSDGSLYVADMANDLIRKITPAGVVSTVAGGGTGGLGDTGPPLSAGLTLPAAVAIDQAGNLYIADTGVNRVRKVSVATGVITTIAGNGSEAFAGDGEKASSAELYGPYSIYYDGQGNLFIGDMFHNRIREINGSLAVLQYDPIRVDRTSPAQLEGFENDGNADMVVPAPTLVNATLDPTTTTCALPQTLSKGTVCVLGVAFSPTSLGPSVQGSVTLASNAGDSPAVVQLSGQVLSVDPTKIVVTSSLNPSGVGTTVTFTAAVSTSGSSMTGTIQFLDGATVLGSMPLIDAGALGRASFSTAALTLGLHSMTAIYSGDATNAASTSVVLTQSVKQQTTLSLTSSPNPSLETATIVLTARVAATGVVPTGSVIFASDGVVLGPGVMDGTGMATLSVATLSIGTHTLTATYAGDPNNGPSNSNTDTQTVNGQMSSITLGTSKAMVQVGEPVTFTTEVAGMSAAAPTGTVTFKDGSSTIGTAMLSGGSAGLTTSGILPGAHTITAHYGGDATYAGSSSVALLEKVLQLSTVTVVSSGVNPSAAGAAITLNATVVESPGNAADSAGGTIGGTVTFLSGDTTIGSAGVSAGGLASVRVTLPLGANGITAVYGGNANYLGSTSAGMVQTVVQAVTSTVLTSSEIPSTVEDPITLAATVTGQGGHPTGTVTFSSDGGVIGTATVNATGVASLTYASLMVGSHGLIASYAGDAPDLPSVSPLLTEIVLLHPSALVLTSSATSLDGGQQVTLIAVIQWTGAIKPTGMVTFQADGTVLGAATVDGSGVATLTINPPTGTTNVTSTYSGDGVFSGSMSATIPVTVGLPPLFTLTVSQTALAVGSLQHTTVTLTASSEKGFSDMLTLGCLGLPQAATCTFSQDRVMLAADGTFTVNVVVDTGSPLTAGSVAKNEVPQPGPSISSAMVAISGLPGGVPFCLLFWKRRKLRKLGGLLLMFCALGMAAGLSGCGSMTVNGTPAGSYKFQITAAAQGAGVIEAVPMTLTVGQ